MTSYDQKLYDVLAKIRLQLAKEANEPAFTVFSNKTLAHMAEVFPMTKEAFLEVHGVGPAKWEKYGQLFLEAIVSYCTENGIIPVPVNAKELAIGGELESLLEKTLNFYVKEQGQHADSPKNLVMNLSWEVEKLVELFRWLSDKQSYHFDANRFEKIRDEIGDIFKTLIHLSYKLGIDPIEASNQKLLKGDQNHSKTGPSYDKG